MSEWRIPRESVELVGPITVTDAGVNVAVFEVAVIPRGARPVTADWSLPTVVGTGKFILVGPGTTRPLTPGKYNIWARHVAAPETPFLDDVGTITIT